jgi:integrase/recombinase XerD
MPRGFKLMLSFASWPTEDRNRWKAAFESGDHFDEGGRGTHLARATRQSRQESYGRYLRFLSANHDDLLALPPEARIDQLLVTEYVSWRRTSCGEMSVAIDLGFLRGALQLICPSTDLSWLLTITRRIAATAPQKPTKYHLVTSDRLYSLGIELMDCAIADAGAASRTRTAHAIQYRDGLIIAFLALIPLRRRTLAALRIGRHLIKAGDLWELDIAASDTKTRRPLDYAISKELSERIDLYLKQLRSLIPGADKHSSLWSSNLSRPMCPDAIYCAVLRRTKKAFGFGVNLHRFRHAAASFWSSHDPVNVRGVKDLLGQASFATTEKHYIMAQSRLAGRALARALGNVGKGPAAS